MLDAIRGWAAHLHGAGIALGLAITGALFVGSIALATVVVVGWRADHFIVGRKGAGLRGVTGLDSMTAGALARTVMRNAAGWLLIVIGAAMTLPGVPGQGLLTMLIGLTLVDFPGKRRLEGRLLGRPVVLGAINRLRARFHRAPLMSPNQPPSV